MCENREDSVGPIKWKMNKDLTIRKHGSVKDIRKWFEEFSSESTIHSMKYLGKFHLHWIERVFWITAFLLAFFTCSFLIRKTYIKWKKDPVLMILNENATPIWQIPFPSITICPETKANIERFNITEVLNRAKRNENLTMEENQGLQSLYQICDWQFEENFSTLQSNTNESINHADVLRQIGSDYLSHSTVAFNEISVPFLNLFNEIITEEGICHSFNLLNYNDLYHEEINSHLKYPKHKQNSNWTPQGYKTMSSSTFPHRAFGSGSKSGMKIFLEMNKRDTKNTCNESLRGFRITLNMPSDTPQPSDNFYSIPLNYQSSLSIRPRVMGSSKDIQNYSPEDRQCYLTDEKYLDFHKIYTQSNSKLESYAYYIAEKCDCFKFSLPHSHNETICGIQKLNCMKRGKTEFMRFQFEMAIKEYEQKGSSKSLDDEQLSEDFWDALDFDQYLFLPSCSSIDYDAEISHTNIYKHSTKISESELESDEKVYVIISIYFKDEFFIKSVRVELYGLLDFLSSCGGFLGLLLGGSFLSLIEILYHLSFKVIFAKRNYDRKDAANATFALTNFPLQHCSKDDKKATYLNVKA